MLALRSFFAKLGFMLILIGLAIGVINSFLDIGEMVYAIIFILAGLLLLLLWFVFPTLFLASRNTISDNSVSNDAVIDNIREFLTENDVKPVIKNNLSEIVSGLFSLNENCEILDSLIKDRFSSWDIYIKYLTPIKALQKEIHKKIGSALKSVEFYSDSVKASQGRTTVKLNEFESNCVKLTSQRLSMLNFQISKLENLRNELANRPDDDDWLKILENEIDELTNNIYLYD